MLQQPLAAELAPAWLALHFLLRAARRIEACERNGKPVGSPRGLAAGATFVASVGPRLATAPKEATQ